MKSMSLMFGVAIVASVACGADRSSSTTQTATTPQTATPTDLSTSTVLVNPTALTTPAPAPTTIATGAVPDPTTKDALLEVTDFPLGARLWAQFDDDGGNPWTVGLCGIPGSVVPISQNVRRFVEGGSDVTRVASERAFVVESILVFAPGDAVQFMNDLPAAAEACRSELRPSGRELFGGGKQFPQIRNEARVYSLETFSCCFTPLPSDVHRPHDIVYIRDGDVILHLYGTDGVEPAARHAEDRLDGVASSD